MTAELAAALVASRARTLMAAKNFGRLMTEFDGDMTCCQEAIDELLEAADQLSALETLGGRNSRLIRHTPPPECIGASVQTL